MNENEMTISPELREKIEKIREMNAENAKQAKAEIDKEFYDTMHEIDLIDINQKARRKSVKTSEKDKIAFRVFNKEISKKQFLKGTCALVMTGIFVTSFKNSAEQTIVDYQNNHKVSEITSEFQRNIINEKTHRCVDPSKFWYDYAGICANAKIESQGDPILGLYMIYSNMGEKYTNDCMSNFNEYFETDYKSVEDFLECHNFKNKKEWLYFLGANMAAEEEQNEHSNTRGQ